MPGPMGNPRRNMSTVKAKDFKKILLAKSLIIELYDMSKRNLVHIIV